MPHDIDMGEITKVVLPLHGVVLVREPDPDSEEGKGLARERALAAERLAPQPPPVGGEGDVWRAVMLHRRNHELKPLLEVRRAQGMERYGTPLTILNGRNHARDALQEALDGMAYLQACHDEVMLLAQRNTQGIHAHLVPWLGRIGIDAKRVQVEWYHLLVEIERFERAYTQIIEVMQEAEMVEMEKKQGGQNG